MPTVSIDIPIDAVPRVKAVVQQHGPMYVPDDVPPDKTAEEWTNAEALAVLKAMLRKYVLDMIKSQESSEAAEVARLATINQINLDNLVN